MSEFKQELFDFLNDFKSNQIDVDWEFLFENGYGILTIYEEVEVLIKGVLLLENTDKAVKESLIGRLASARAGLSIFMEKENGLESFVKYGKDLEQTMKDILKTGNWVKLAEQRFEKYEQFEAKLEEMESEEDFDFEALDELRPVFMAVSIMNVMTVDEEDEMVEDEE